MTIKQTARGYLSIAELVPYSTSSSSQLKVSAATVSRVDKRMATANISKVGRLKRRAGLLKRGLLTKQQAIVPQLEADALP